MNIDAIKQWSEARAVFDVAKEVALAAAVADVESHGLPVDAVARLYGFSESKLRKVIES
jgi:hypothetical protein